MTATVTATAAADPGGPRRTPVPVTSDGGTGVRAGPRVPVTTDQKAG